MSNNCGCNEVDGFPPFRYQSTPQDPPTAYQIETSQKNVEDYLGRLRTAIASDIDCLCTLLESLGTLLEALETRIEALESP